MKLADRSSAPTPANAVLEAGRVVAGKYQLTRLIGQGGMGAVWAAVHLELGMEVALKLLRPEGVSDTRVGERFVAEARMAAAVKHRFVVDIFDYGTEHGQPFMALELLQGQELGARIQHGPALPVKDAVRFIAQCLSGLEAVHKAGVIHRDLKPENIFLISDRDGVFPKLLDFGVALMNDAVSAGENAREASGPRRRRLTKAGITVGTPSYMAPEQLRAHALDVRADLYSMGVILFELLAGRVPFADDNVADLLVRVMTEDAPRLKDVRPELGRALSDVVSKAMAKDREQRFANADEMRAALNGLIATLPEDAYTIVQDGQTTSGIGAYTDLLLQAANDPFRQRPTSRAWHSGPRARWGAGIGAAVISALLLAWTMGGNNQIVANAQKASPSAQNPPAPLLVAQNEPPRLLQPEPDSLAAPLAPQPASAMPVAGAKSDGSTKAPKTAGTRVRSSSSKRSIGAARTRAHHVRAPKKLFRTLDF
jgi:serine/threonine-protein kinase